MTFRKLPGLKPRGQINVPDERQRAFVHPDTLEPITFEHHYEEVEAVTLSSTAPLEVIDAFDRARNAFLYSWFVYELGSLAEMQGYSTLELALRIRLKIPAGKRAPGLSDLLSDAIAQGIVLDPQSHLKGGIASVISTMRNTWGHGTDNLLDPNTTIQALRRSADMINQLFPPVIYDPR
jgi:hypothetical protein